MLESPIRRSVLLLFLVHTFLAQHETASAATNALSQETVHRTRPRPFLRVPVRAMAQYARIKPDLSEFMDDDDFYELNKRQTSDDYGHLRFGKRDEFDDYGHMRFGRSSGGSTASSNGNN